MRKTLLTLSSAVAILSAPLLAPANAMTVGTAKGIAEALADTSAAQEVAYVCRHRYYTSRRICWWEPRYRHRGWRWRRWR
jgi:hypothetical protein